MSAPRLETDAVVAHVEHDDVREVREGHPDPGRVRVLRDVRQRFLGDTEERRPDVVGQGQDGARDLDLHRDPRRAGPPDRVLRERLAERGALELLGPQGPHGPARLRQALPGQGAGAVQVGATDAVVGGAVSGLELGDDAREALRERVVDLAGEPLTLVLDPGLACLLQELRVQPGVLSDCRFQAEVRLGELRVALDTTLGDHEQRHGDAVVHSADEHAGQPSGEVVRVASELGGREHQRHRDHRPGQGPVRHPLVRDHETRPGEDREPRVEPDEHRAQRDVDREHRGIAGGAVATAPHRHQHHPDGRDRREQQPRPQPALRAVARLLRDRGEHCGHCERRQEEAAAHAVEPLPPQVLGGRPVGADALRRADDAGRGGPGRRHAGDAGDPAPVVCAAHDDDGVTPSGRCGPRPRRTPRPSRP
ncbi:hypothetical protein GCM10025864_02180 [Luteimicrobium album]|uniref:Uncharacterized protein n=1 Tax=Luteimicrobium album TaxID=1054550 RepID=A0ABQ6HY93_9MICO|nr:hypothetical protein GCM10025864_02180 [Luteimicrobium album]